ncbi:Nif3-like dinuclear metal center hexameric protein [Nocardioides mangrovicus]|uniref:GTP cyclohydrolase 1 type 2 homolog n=1 Tax=Nocardioides mangrovicus TaxID=2478913 RepID=A0A3L8P3N9_9ACTN|nr:Nif3-like dinuclear metal center hexameric protein [Nocardioides mangrovicus]RLV49038.1 Nif3-like dinuclear metal center hexameric protein [Nocardioides mangrovicus]
MTPQGTTVGDVLALMERWYPARWADDWDRVGLVCGDPAAEVSRVVLAVDPVAAVVAETVEVEAQLLITHHPLYLKGTSSVAATTPKGRVVHTLVSHGCALFAAHTNADAPADGVSEALALTLGLEDVRPLDPDAAEPLDKLVVYVPADHAERIRQVLAEWGAGRIGDYDSASFSSDGEGRFRPLSGARPAIGTIGELETVPEVRIEVVLPRFRRRDVVEAMLAAHPYEEPAYDVVGLASLDEPARGSGRIGVLRDPMSLREFAALVDQRLRPTAHGVRVAGEPDQPVRTVALCGGAGDFLLDRARAAGADVYLTSDLRHHPASELREHAVDGDPSTALVDVAHWAAEWTWLPVLQRKLVDELGDTVEVLVSTAVTDPWTFRA